MGTYLAWPNPFRVPWSSGALLALVLSASTLGACGASAPAPSAPDSTPHAAAPAYPGGSSTAHDDAPEEAPKAAACDDGTCISCGAGICPSGWYCDESAKGGAACGWLPRCAQKPSCACLVKVLGAGCSCTEQGSGMHVTCT